MRQTLLALTLVLASTAAHAKLWQVDAAQSTLTFTGAQANIPFTGNFARFTPVIDFDPTAPEKASITVTIAMASAAIPADKEQNDSLPTADWFNVEQFPEAKFQSTAIHTTGKDSYEARGTLTIRDVTQEITLPFTLQPEGDATRAEGTTTIQRQLFKLGGSQWADDKWIAYPVTVTYSILAR